MSAALRWALFRALERLSDWRGNNARGAFALHPDGGPVQPALWLYVSTIGELNAVAPFIDTLLADCADLEPVLITEHAHYREAYQARYPQARVCISRGHSSDAARLARQCPPRLLVLAEIPALPSDAPCRFSFAFVREARRHGAPTQLVNGWLYHYPPASRMDALERRLLQADYLRALDLICVQDQACADELQRQGAPAARLKVLGNMKFDAMQRPAWRPEQTRAPALLQGLLDSGRPIVVAGCVTELDEAGQVLQAFSLLRQTHPQALLVLAPRHPENQARMAQLLNLITAQDLSLQRRSSLGDTLPAADTTCLLLDTVGELRDFYAVARVAHVGVDHNVLEPLGLGKPLTVLAGWNASYPSYPVFHLLHSQGALALQADAQGLASYWARAVAGEARIRQDLAHTEAVLQSMRGALARHLQAARPQWPHPAPPGSRA
jgi:3-deoxy-D-manno-octulosonic-acid transferase